MTTQIKIWDTVVGAVRGVVLLGIMLGGVAQVDAAVFMANGIKIGEVTQTSAILWTRLTQQPERNHAGFAFPELKRKDNPTEAKQLQGHALEEMEGAVPGAAGEGRFLYWAGGGTAGWDTFFVARGGAEPGRRGGRMRGRSLFCAPTGRR